MAVKGDDIIKSCAICYRNRGLSVKLAEQGKVLVCTLDAGHRFRIESGMLVEVKG